VEQRHFIVVQRLAARAGELPIGLHRPSGFAAFVITRRVISVETGG
jgi:hypothetical protein